MNIPNGFKVGDIIYTKHNEVWHDRDPHLGWHKIKKFCKFKIANFRMNYYTTRVEILNEEENFEISMSASYLPEDFYTEKEYRKNKLIELCLK